MPATRTAWTPRRPQRSAPAERPSVLDHPAALAAIAIAVALVLKALGEDLPYLPTVFVA